MDADKEKDVILTVLAKDLADFSVESPKSGIALDVSEYLSMTNSDSSKSA